MMALILCFVLAFGIVWFFRAANRLLGIFKPRPKHITIVKKDLPKETEPVPTVTNIQYNHTQVIIIEAPK
jgi:hypothetical protein